MDLYRHGITGKLVEYAVKKYKSHRRIPHYVIQINFIIGSSYIQKGSFFVIYRTLQISIRFSMVIFCKNHSCSCDALIRCDI
jgi:predicted ATPase